MVTLMKISILLALITIASFIMVQMAGAADDEGKKASPAKTEEKVITTESGLKYVEVLEGKGPAAKAGDTVEVHYAGRLADGKEFDNSFKRGKPIEFVLGTGRVIKGWDEGVAGMK